MNYKQSRNLMWIGFGAGLLFMCFGMGLENNSATLFFMIAGTMLFFLALFQAFIFYKCPYCGYSLMNVKGDIPKHCPECGKDLT